MDEKDKCGICGREATMVVEIAESDPTRTEEYPVCLDHWRLVNMVALNQG